MFAMRTMRKLQGIPCVARAWSGLPTPDVSLTQLTPRERRVPVVQAARRQLWTPTAAQGRASAHGDSDVWCRVDEYLEEHSITAKDAKHVEAALAASKEAGLPAINVAPCQGKMLALYVRMMQATRVLEVGTLGGYSTIWMAREVADRPGGHVTTVELDAHHASVAQANVDAAGLHDVVDIRVGSAVDVLATIAASKPDPFDFVFIDADKPSNVAYLEAALGMSRPGTVIVVDNVVRDASILNAEQPDPSAKGCRDMFDMIAADSRLDATSIQTVGSKGYDGFTLAIVTDKV